MDEKIKTEFQDKEDCNNLDISSKLLKKWEIDMGDIEIQKEYFSSTYSTVYIGIQKSTNTIVAVKQYNNSGEDDSTLQDFRNEFQVLSVLNHFAISHFIGATFSPKYSIITQFLSGGTLYSRLHSKHSYAKLHPTQLSIIALGIAYGMTYLHSKNVIHRDLKSLNILLDENSFPTISDFGTSAKKDNRFLTAGVGTAQWMAPEVLNSQPYNHKVDVYSYGMILWEMLTGDIPFNGFTQMEVALAVVTEKVRPKIPLNCPKNLARLIRTCWDDDPSKRPEFKRIVDVLESLSITFSGTDLKQLQEYKNHFTSTKQISVMNDQIENISLTPTKSSPLSSTYLLSSQTSLNVIDSKTIEKLIDNLQKSTEPIPKFIQIAENQSLVSNLSNYGQIMVYLSNHLRSLKYLNNSNDVFKIIHLLSLLLTNEQLKESFFNNNCQNSLLFVLSEFTTSLIPKLLDCLLIVVRSDDKLKLETKQLNRISSYLLCADMNVRQTAANLLLQIAEKKNVVHSLDDFSVIVGNLLVNLYPEMNNSTFLRSIIGLLLILVQHCEKAKNQIILLYGPEKIITLLTSKSHHVLDLALDLSIALCSDETVRSRTYQLFVDEFTSILNNATESSDLLYKLHQLIYLYFKDKSMLEYISSSDDFIPNFIKKCINFENNKNGNSQDMYLVLSMKLLYVLCRTNCTMNLLYPFIDDIIKHLSLVFIPKIPIFAALSIAALLSTIENPKEKIKNHSKDLENFAKFAFSVQNETTMAALSLFGVLSNLRETHYICASLSIHNNIIKFLKSDNSAVIKMTIRVLISMSSSSFGGELKDLSKAIKPLFSLCDTNNSKFGLFGIEPLVCISNILLFPDSWKSAIPFIEKLINLYDIPEFTEIAFLITYRIVSAAEFSLSVSSSEEVVSLFDNKKIIHSFVEKTKKKLTSTNNDLLISILLCFSEVESSCSFLKEEQIVDIIDEIIFQYSINDIRRPKLLRIHSYLSIHD